MKTTITVTKTITITTTSTTKWLDKAKEMHSLSDYALAPMLGITRSQMSRYRTGVDFLSDDAAIKLAALLGMESPAAIIASAHSERSKSADVKAFWSQWAEKLGGVAASVTLMVGMMSGMGYSPDVQAAGSSGNNSNSNLQSYTSYQVKVTPTTYPWVAVRAQRQQSVRLSRHADHGGQSQVRSTSDRF